MNDDDGSSFAPIRFDRALSTALPLVLAMVVLILAVWTRFDGITQQGISAGDSFEYLSEAKRWADGLEPDFIGDHFYRPTAFLLEGLAIRFGGYNDYSIKVLNASIDTFNILLIFGIVAFLCRNLWCGLGGALIYAFLPTPIYYARSEMIHAESMVLVLLSFLAFIGFERLERDKSKTVARGGVALLALAGLMLGIATNSHADLAFLAPTFVGFIAYLAIAGRATFPPIRIWFIHAAIYTVGFFLPYLAGVMAFGWDRVYEVISTEISYGQSHIVIDTGHESKPLIFFNVFRYSFQRCFGNEWVMGILFLGVPAIMIYRAIRNRPAPALMYLPLALLVGYAATYSAFSSSFGWNFARLFIPLMPFVIFSILYWYHAFAKDFLGRGAPIAVLMVCATLFFANARNLPGEATIVTPYRGVYDVVGEYVDEENRLLIAPIMMYFRDRGYQHDLYFGNDAEYLIEIPLQGTYTLDNLEKSLEGKNFSYLLLASRLDDRVLYQDTGLRKAGRTWVRSELFEYDFEHDVATLQAYIQRRGGRLVARTAWGEIYALGTLDGPTLSELGAAGAKKEFVQNGSFESWSRFGRRPKEWVVKYGKADRTREASDGEFALRLIPQAIGASNGTRVMQSMRNSISPVGRLLRVQMDVRASLNSRVGFMVQALVNGEGATISKGPDGQSNWVRSAGKGEWQTLSCDIELTADIDLSVIALYIKLWPGAEEAAFVDNVSVTIRN